MEYLLSNDFILLNLRDPCHPRCRGLMLLETFTTLPISQLRANLPPFLAITEEVTGDPAFSMYNLALRYINLLIETTRAMII